jgi:hypothetical protein
MRELMRIPNVGVNFAEDLLSLGIRSVDELKDREPLELYRALCEKTGSRQDPCVLDTFMAVVDFANSGESRKWWEFTPERKARYPKV